MKIQLERIKANENFMEKKSGFVDSGFVKTCDELVIGLQSERMPSRHHQFGKQSF